MAQIAHITQLPLDGDAPHIRVTNGSPAGASLTGPATQPLEERVAETGELRDLANLSWPDRPLNLMAADVMDLEGQGAMKTIAAMIELTLYLGRDRFDVLHLEDIGGHSATGIARREWIYRLQTLIYNTARSMNITSSKVTLEQSGTQFHLQVLLPSYATHRH